MRGPGWDVFTRSGAWPAVRKTVIDYHAAALPGDILRFQQALTHLGRTSFTMRQTARRVRDDTLIATAEFVFVCVNRDGRPIAVPREFSDFMSPRRSGADAQRLTVNGVSLAVEVRGEGPAVLFIHGYPMDRSIWAHPMAMLDGFRRIAPDLRGMGQSDAPDLGYSIETYAGDLAALLDALGCGRGGAMRSLDGRLHRLRVSPPVAPQGARSGADGHPGGGRHTGRQTGAGRRRRNRARGRRLGHRREHAPEAGRTLHPHRGAGDRRTGARHGYGYAGSGDRRRAGSHAGPARQHRGSCWTGWTSDPDSGRRGGRGDSAGPRPGNGGGHLRVPVSS